MPTSLVTGCAGFIGSHLTERLLASGDRVVGIDSFVDFYDPAIKRQNLAAAATNDAFTLIEADIRDRDAVRSTFADHGVQRVVHLAALAGVRPSIERPAEYTDVNLNGTANILDAAADAKVTAFAFASSSSVYGNNDKVPFAETDPVDFPISPYAATKRAGELLAHTYHHLHNLPIACLRFFTVYGPRQRPDLAIGKFMRMIADGQTIPVFGDGSTSRDYTYIDDIIDGIVASLAYAESTGRYEIFNLGSHRPIALSELIAAIETAVGRSAVINRLSMQPGDVNRTYADVAKSERLLGYKPSVSLEHGLAEQWKSIHGSSL